MPLQREITSEEQAAGYYQHGNWKGYPKFYCVFCAFDSLHELTIRSHVINRHQMQLIAGQTQRPTVSMDVLLYDGSGRIISEREATDAEVDDFTS